MVAWTHFQKFSVFALGTGCGLLPYLYQKLKQPNVVYSSQKNGAAPINQCALWDNNWDFREPKCIVSPRKNNTAEEYNRYYSDLEQSCTKVKHHIILIRHGEYRDIGEMDETHKLTQLGRLQAQYTGKRLAELGINCDKIVVSTMTRAQETADIILKELQIDRNEVEHCDLIREGLPIPPQPPLRAHWRLEKRWLRDGGRIEAGFRKYFHRAPPTENEDTYTLIVAHANVIRYFVCRALQLPPEAWLRLSINHASITWLSVMPTGRTCIRYLGDTGYMPAKFLTSSKPQ